jgi:hypothetical protein
MLNMKILLYHLLLDHTGAPLAIIVASLDPSPSSFQARWLLLNLLDAERVRQPHRGLRRQDLTGRREHYMVAELQKPIEAAERIYSLCHRGFL